MACARRDYGVVDSILECNCIGLGLIGGIIKACKMTFLKSFHPFCAYFLSLYSRKYLEILVFLKFCEIY